MKLPLRPLRTLPALFRLKLSLMVAFSSLAGFIRSRGSLSWKTLFVFSGVALLSAAASAFNQFQERDADALMERTRNRPLLSKRISGRAALTTASISAVAGLALLFFRASPPTALMGFLTLILYNGVYTPLKRKTLYAMLPGALTGALPPCIGYIAAGRSIDLIIICVAAFMFFWQIAHVLLVTRQYGGEYGRAGFPTLASAVSEKKLRVTIAGWLAAAFCCVVLFPVLGVITNTWLIAGVMATAAGFAGYFYAAIIRESGIRGYSSGLGSMHLFQGCMLLGIIVQGLMGI